MSIEKKLVALTDLLNQMGSIVVAYSGGVDSAFLAKIAYQTLGEKTLAITASSETYTPGELAEAVELAKVIGVPHLVIETQELSNEEFANNPPNRCYYCKSELFTKLWDIARSRGHAQVVDGANTDDSGDFRPGIMAGRKLGVRSPLQEAGLSKEEIRMLSKQMELPTWNKPSMACLSSRFPYGDAITPAKLQQVYQGEEFLRQKGFSQLRVRHHNTIARIEIPVGELTLLTEEKLRQEVVQFFKNLGYTYVALDLAGFSSGSMNLALPEEVKDGYQALEKYSSTG